MSHIAALFLVASMPVPAVAPSSARLNRTIELLDTGKPVFGVFGWNHSVVGLLGAVEASRFVTIQRAKKQRRALRILGSVGEKTAVGGYRERRVQEPPLKHFPKPMPRARCPSIASRGSGMVDKQLVRYRI